MKREEKRGKHGRILMTDPSMLLIEKGVPVARKV